MGLHSRVKNKFPEDGKRGIPVRGIEPRPPGWKPEILTTRPHGMGEAGILPISKLLKRENKNKILFPRRKKGNFPCGESNPGRLGENQKS